MEGNFTDMDKYLISRLDSIDAKIEKYFKVQEEKITKLRVRMAGFSVIISLIISLSTTVVTARIKNDEIKVLKHQISQQVR